MWLRLAACAAFLVVPVAYAQTGTAPSSTLSLDDAIARVATTHPDLRIFDGRRQVLDANLASAALKPPMTLGATIENTLGTGNYRGFSEAELTVTLAGVIERGGKLNARQALALANIDTLAPQREMARLDLLAETARRYLAAAAARDQGDIGRIDVEQRRRTVAAARHRHQAGASPESVVLTAEAALVRAELAVERAAQQEQAARQHLAALWGERDPAFGLAAADPLALPPLVELDELAAWLERTPELLRFADEQRVGEARLQLARSATAADLDWQVGVRRLQESGDTALVGSLSLPLGPTHRAGPEIRAAEAGLAALAIERESRDVALYSTLVQAHGRYRVGQQDVQRTAQDILPRLARAERAAERAYQAGAISYLEWAQLQSERIAVQREQLAAALEAHAALIEIQRLTGQPFVTGAVASGQGTAP